MANLQRNVRWRNMCFGVQEEAIAAYSHQRIGKELKQEISKGSMPPLTHAPSHWIQMVLDLLDVSLTKSRGARCHIQTWGFSLRSMISRDCTQHCFLAIDASTMSPIACHVSHPIRCARLVTFLELVAEATFPWTPVTDIVQRMEKTLEGFKRI